MTESQKVATTARAIARALNARLYEASSGRDYGLSELDFEQVLSVVAERYCASASDKECRTVLESLRHEELALARGCALGNENAWEVFLTRYRSSLYSAAMSIVRNDAAARELADGLYAELYGMDERDGERRSKLLYYMGRGSLEGWLRTVLAQRWVDIKRRARREVSLEEQLEAGCQFEAPATSSAPAPALPINEAVAAVLAGLASEERFLLASYYLDGRTLAQIALVMGVHESTISRKLDRVVVSLRKELRKRLIAGGLSPGAADEAMQTMDVRDLEVKVQENLKQETPPSAF